jgi:hypothetical protein
MPFSGTYFHSKFSKFFHDNASGARTEISDAVTDVDWGTDYGLHDTTPIGTTGETYISGYANSKVKISGTCSRAQHQFFTDVEAAFLAGTLVSVTLEWGPEGTDAGDVKRTAEAVLTSYNPSSKSKDLVSYTAEYQVTGNNTDTTY